ncbi:tail fiber assembly protein [Pseudomonas chlororaphis]|uniref:tail fiber assembly protein n=1 Tax=Pseudomonas chlororaphis TaxID=587753 RepID=UPI002365D84F|nr:tail fiber assembly protein [Pseudomonas chlororaphis]WDH25058.1 tail fiber assembly protein [Pseudomonas chlororaphis]
MNYKLSEGESVTTDTGLWIPADPENADWQDYLLWLAAGNTPAQRFSETELKQQKLLEASLEISRLRSIADYAIRPLQDAADVEEASAAEDAELKTWKRYRLALSRVEDQPGYPETIDWPELPA